MARWSRLPLWAKAASAMLEPLRELLINGSTDSGGSVANRLNMAAALYLAEAARSGDGRRLCNHIGAFSQTLKYQPLLLKSPSLRRKAGSKYGTALESITGKLNEYSSVKSR